MYAYRYHDIKEILTSDTVVFYFMVITFFSMVLILPMAPMLMFVYTEDSPSINPAVYRYLKHAGNQGKENLVEGLEGE